MLIKDCKSKTTRVFLVLIWIAGICGVIPVEAITSTAAGETIRVSLGANGVQGNGYSTYSSISDDGRFIVFASESTNLVPDDTNGTSDIFVRDLQMNTTTRISVDANGIQSNGYSFDPSISTEGRYIVFDSAGTNLVSNDTNGTYDVFLHDTQLNITTLVSVGSNGIQGNNSTSRSSISEDGRFVAFQSSATNLVSGDTNGMPDIFVHDTQTRTTTRVSVGPNDIQANSYSYYPFISANGNFVVFESNASNLVPNDTNGKADIFIHNLITATTSIVSVDSNNVLANNFSQHASISDDGRYVVFESYANNLVPNDTNSYFDVFIRDLEAGITKIISIDSYGVQGNNSSSNSFLSGNGRYIVFESIATNLVPNDTNAKPDIFVHDRLLGLTSRISVSSNGDQADNYSCPMTCYPFKLSTSKDGRYITFTSYAANLIEDDTNVMPDVFLHEQQITQISNIIYVKWNAAGANNGTSWTDAYTDLQSALSAASQGDEIWVAAGIYKPTTGADRTASFLLKDGTALYGGFAGSETTRDQRDPTVNITVLSGDLSENDNNNIEAYEPTRAENVLHVVSYGYTSEAAVLDGFTITGGNANGDRGDTARGGGVWNDAGNLILANLIITDNSSLEFGGGMFNQNSSLSTLENITFTNNTSFSGGGLTNLNSSPALSNVTFANNAAIDSGGGVVNMMGSSPTFLNVTFSGNTATNFGGGMSNYNSSPTIYKSSFYNNEVFYIQNEGKGAGIYNSSSNPVIENTSFSGNHAPRGGSGIANVMSDPVITNVTFTQNWDAIRNFSSHPVVRNSIIWGNTYYDSGDVITITDDANSNAIVSDSVVQNGYPGGNNIITTDPLLGSLDMYGGMTKTVSLKPGSPAIDAGNDASCPSTDQRGVTRPQGSHCDIGAYEADETPIPNIVTNTNDSGLGSLRQTIADAAPGDTITFDPSLTGQTITLASTLVVNKDLTIDGTGQRITISGNDLHQILSIESWEAVIYINALTITNGYSMENGGGITSIGELIVTNSTFSNNHADNFGGGIFNNYSRLTIKNSTFSDNSAFNGGGVYSGPVLRVANSTFSGNTAQSEGGGIYGQFNAFLEITNSTFSDNSAQVHGGGIYDNGSLTIMNSIIANTIMGQDCYGDIDFNINNLVEDGTCLEQGTNFQTGDPKIGPLTDNGGPTQTMALLPGSPLIDAGEDTYCPATDQRDETRPQGSHCDIGAYEALQTTHGIPLLQGWNLVSFNVHPTDTSTASVLSSIAGSYDLVYAWDATGAHAASGNWLRADNLPESPDSLTSLNETMGFWIRMTAADTLDVVGTVPQSTIITLLDNAGGWNLVGYPSNAAGDLPTILSDQGVGTDFSMLYAYHPEDAEDVWKIFDASVPPFINDLTQLASGFGYWVKVNADHTWVVPYGAQ